MEAGAQKEIRDYANAIYDLVKGKIPIVMEAFMDFRVNAVTFTGPEIEAIKNKTFTLESPGENREFQEKINTLGLKNKIE
jgi:thymidylate synthase (FAD)